LDEINMNKTMGFKLAALVAPLLVMLTWVASLALHVQTGSEVELRITGYDPRDLLAGHYLRYQVEYGAPIDCRSGEALCLFLRQDAHGIATAESYGSCQESTAGALKLKGECRHGGFIANIERFYFPEKHGKTLAIVPDSATILVKIDEDGDGMVTDLKVKGLPLQEWLQQNGK
jgi:uncharacterized membrane-anchored protein